MTEQDFREQLSLIAWRKKLIDRDEEIPPDFVVYRREIAVYCSNAYLGYAAGRYFPKSTRYGLKIFVGKQLWYQAP